MESRQQLELRQRAEHVAKYDALLRTLGPDSIRAMVEPLVARCMVALQSGDEHLNTIPLPVWDKLALGPEPERPPACTHCGHRPPGAGLGHSFSTTWPQDQLRATARAGVWSRARGLSLAERVCVLKHAARLLALGAWKD